MKWFQFSLKRFDKQLVMLSVLGICLNAAAQTPMSKLALPQLQLSQSTSELASESASKSAPEPASESASASTLEPAPKSVPEPASASTLAPASPTVQLPAQPDTAVQTPAYLTSSRWTPTVREQINAFCDTYAFQKPDGVRPYAVFDFDNTTAMFDVTEHTVVYQLERLRFAIPPERMYEVMTTGIEPSRLDEPLGVPSSATVRNAAMDISTVYSVLYQAGCVSVDGSALTAEKAQKFDAEIREFSAKVWWLYNMLDEKFGADVAYPWVICLFAGMTSEEVQTLSKDAMAYYETQTSQPGYFVVQTLASPENYPSRVGKVEMAFRRGFVVFPELRELYSCLAANGIDVCICSASLRDIVVGAVDYFHLPGIVEILGLESKKDAAGRLLNAYDYEPHAMTQGTGKTDTIRQLLAPRYHGHGPVFTAGDSWGDFDFCTQFPETRICLILNRVRSDDYGMLAATAVWQNEQNLTFADVERTGQCRFLLQGRNELIGQCWPKEETFLLGKPTPQLLSPKAKQWLTVLRKAGSPNSK